MSGHGFVRLGRPHGHAADGSALKLWGCNWALGLRAVALGAEGRVLGQEVDQEAVDLLRRFDHDHVAGVGNQFQSGMEYHLR